MARLTFNPDLYGGALCAAVIGAAFAGPIGAVVAGAGLILFHKAMTRIMRNG